MVRNTDIQTYKCPHCQEYVKIERIEIDSVMCESIKDHNCFVKDNGRLSRITKLKRLVQHPNSYFLDIKCANCSNIKTGVFSHSQCVITCNRCSKVLAVSTGGKMKIVMEGCRFRKAKNQLVYSL